MKIFNLKYYSGILLAMLFFSSCDNNRNRPGYSYFNDMEESQAYETYSENPYMPGNKTMTGPVEGTVHTEEHAYNFVKTPEDELKAASLKNPLSNNFDQEEAKVLYNRFCINCHGEFGDGKGFLFTSGKYPIPPASYHADRAMNKTDGQLFHNIRAGFGVMGAHGPQMSVDDTWQLVNYIRHLQEEGVPESETSEETTAENNSETVEENTPSEMTQTDSLPE
jgi:mono/diheme cytochrome c family protein